MAARLRDGRSRESSRHEYANRRKAAVIRRGGFAGLACAKRLGGSEFRVTLGDRWNHHLFQPLLHQVATGGLAMTEIAQPLRSILVGLEVKGLVA